METTHLITVGQLIEALKDVDPATPIVMSKDGEGNSYSPLSQLDPTARYVPDTTWSGDVLHPDDYDSHDDHTNVVCLWPVN